MNEETVLLIAATIAAVIGSPLVQGIKSLYQLIVGAPLEGKPALWVTVGIAAALGIAAVAVAGYFSPPYPTAWQGWVTLFGGAIGAIFAAMTVIYKQLLADQNNGTR